MSEIEQLRAELAEKTRALSEAQSRWIPVSERLPEPHVRVVIAYLDDGLPEVDAGEHDGATWRWDVFLAMSEPPTHWMPLPEAPK